MPVMHIVSVQMLCILYIKHKNTSTARLTTTCSCTKFKQLTSCYIPVCLYSKMVIFVYAAKNLNTNMTEKVFCNNTQTCNIQMLTCIHISKMLIFCTYNNTQAYKYSFIKYKWPCSLACLVHISTVS